MPRHGRKATERSAQSFRDWVYNQNPAARQKIDPEVIKVKKQLGHIDNTRRQLTRDMVKGKVPR